MYTRQAQAWDSIGTIFRDGLGLALVIVSETISFVLHSKMLHKVF